MNIVIFSLWVQQVGEKGSQADVIKCYLILKSISVTPAHPPTPNHHHSRIQQFPAWEPW